MEVDHVDFRELTETCRPQKTPSGMLHLFYPRRKPKTPHSLHRVPWPRLRRVRLGNIVWLWEEKYGDLLIWHVGNVNGAMRPVTRLVPIDLPGCDRDMLLGTSVAEFNGQSGSLEDDRYTVTRIPMPPRGLAGCEQ